jgi:hypothetical protein
MFKIQNSEQGGAGIAFWSLGFWSFELVSDFDIGASSFRHSAAV